MFGTTQESRPAAHWNVLTDDWLDVMDLEARARICSPLSALNQARHLSGIAAASPLDLFAAHRFLLTLLYWKAGTAEGVRHVRESLLAGEIPPSILAAIEAEAPRFGLFGARAPFLQDPFALKAKPARQDLKSAGSLFAEYACGTNIAHFHHGDDDGMRLCLRCATVGMMRVVPWTQAGGAGKPPSVHNAPPFMAIARGENLAVTLGLNLVPLAGNAGRPKWTGHFVPKAPDSAIPYMEAFTWNPRRIHLLAPETASVCWRCGRADVRAVGPILYLKNPPTKQRREGRDLIPFAWQDPAAFYTADSPYKTRKSTDESTAARGDDLARLLDDEDPSKAAVVEGNPGHLGWRLVIPCTNPANNKVFDHRQLDLPDLSPASIRAALPGDAPERGLTGRDGWREPRRSRRAAGAARFVSAAVQALTHGDWGVLSAAAYRDMHDSPQAFDVFSGLWWALRGKIALPSKSVAWLVLKLMGAVPSRARVPQHAPDFHPLRFLAKRQIDERRANRRSRSPYPVSLPRGRRLEAALRSAIDRNMRCPQPKAIDWSGLCDGLDQLLD